MNVKKKIFFEGGMFFCVFLDCFVAARSAKTFIIIIILNFQLLTVKYNSDITVKIIRSRQAIPQFEEGLKLLLIKCYMILIRFHKISIKFA
jgi:hypothetical protein